MLGLGRFADCPFSLGGAFPSTPPPHLGLVENPIAALTPCPAAFMWRVDMFLF